MKGHLIPTKNKNVNLVIDDNTSFLQYLKPGEALWGHQYLYFVDDSEIKVGDYYLVQHNIEGHILSDKMILNKADKNFICNYYIKNTIYFKVILSTDDKLNMPIQKEDIESFIKEYNLKIQI